MARQVLLLQQGMSAASTSIYKTSEWSCKAYLISPYHLGNLIGHFMQPIRWIYFQIVICTGRQQRIGSVGGNM